MRGRVALAALIVLVVVLQLASRHPLSAEPASAAELAPVATQFNRGYKSNDVGLVWDHFDAASELAISRARYVLWRRECPRTLGVATTLGVSRVSPGRRDVRNEISEVTLRLLAPTERSMAFQFGAFEPFGDIALSVELRRLRSCDGLYWLTTRRLNSARAVSVGVGAPADGRG